MKTILLLAAASTMAVAAPVTWVDWTSGTTGAAGSAAGVLTLGAETVNVSYSGEVAFIITGAGTNYFNPTAPYISALVDNAPPASDIIALSVTGSKTLTFSRPIDNLFFAIVSLNGNGYRFDGDFEIVSGNGIGGYWGSGTLTKTNPSPGVYQLNGSGEPHGVIRFTGAVSSITWSSLTNEFWNGFTVGTYGLAAPAPSDIPEPGTWALGLLGLAPLVARRLRRS